jgi:PAS domain S-box-containing protein
VIGAQIGLFIQRKSAENESRANEIYKTAILDSASDSIITTSDKGKIISFNPQTKKLFHYQDEELQNKQIDLIIPDLTIQLNTLAGKSASEFTGRSKNGPDFPVEITLSKMTLYKQEMFVIIIRDITERRKIDKMKNEFVSVVSHELRTPLTSIIGSLRLILGGALGPLSDKIKKMLDIANVNCERLLHLINDILDIDKIEAGKMDFKFEIIDIEELVTKAVAINNLYGEKDNIKIKITKTLHNIKVNIDPERLTQVLTNLISNAVKFSSPGNQVDVTITQHDDKVRVSVIDYGHGIPKDFQSQIFQKFSQADSSATRSKSGTGLGLSISKTIIEKLNGTLKFKSEPNKETVFYVDLPIWHKE